MKDIHWAVIFILVWSLKSGNGMNTGTSGITTTKPKGFRVRAYEISTLIKVLLPPNFIISNIHNTPK